MIEAIDIRTFLPQEGHPKVATRLHLSQTSPYRKVEFFRIARDLRGPKTRLKRNPDRQFSPCFQMLSNRDQAIRLRLSVLISGNIRLSRIRAAVEPSFDDDDASSFLAKRFLGSVAATSNRFMHQQLIPNFSVPSDSRSRRAEAVEALLKMAVYRKARPIATLLSSQYGLFIVSPCSGA